MANSEKFKTVIQKVVNDLLLDIVAGHGDEIIEIPRENENMIIPVKDCIHELQHFWEGKQGVTRFELFASILRYCAGEDKVLIDSLTILIIDKYPEKEEAKLTSGAINDLVNKFYNFVEEPITQEATVTEIAAEPIIIEGDQTGKKKDQNKGRAVSPEYQEMVNCKNAMAKERANIAYAGKH